MMSWTAHEAAPRMVMLGVSPAWFLGGGGGGVTRFKLNGLHWEIQVDQVHVLAEPVGDCPGVGLLEEGKRRPDPVSQHASLTWMSKACLSVESSRSKWSFSAVLLITLMIKILGRRSQSESP